MPKGFMKKIYEFNSTNPERKLLVEEKQASPHEVVIRIICEGGDEYVLPFPLSEFTELCNLRYSLQFPLSRS
jgi:hypothetical protein